MLLWIKLTQNGTYTRGCGHHTYQLYFGLRMCKMLPYKYPTVRSHLNLFSSSPFVGCLIFISSCDGVTTTSSKSTIFDSTMRIQGVTWAEEMDIRDPMLDDDDPSSPAAGVPTAISVVPVTDRTNQFLNRVFTNKMTGTNAAPSTAPIP